MKKITILTMVLIHAEMTAQSLNVGHMPPPHDHHTSICYGYAMARVYSKASALECNPDLCYADGMDPNYFTEHPGAGLSGIQEGDIITWTSNSGLGGHAAYVISVPQPLVVGNILVQQVAFLDYPPDPPMYVRDISQGPILGYWRLTDNTKYYLTVENSFGSGNVRVGRSWATPPGEGAWVEYNSGTTFLLHRNTKVTFMAVTPQIDQNGNSRNFQLWLFNGQNDGSANPHAEITLSNTAVYRAEYNLILNVTPSTVVSGTLLLGPDDGITIEQNGKLTVTGQLTIIGTSGDRHVLAPLSGTWQGIEFNGSVGSSLQYCDINYALSPIVAKNSTTNLTVSYCAIGNSDFNGVSPDWAAAAIALYGSNASISSTTINGGPNSQNGVRFASGSTGSLTWSTIQNCGAGNGIVVQGGSSPTISGNTITSNYYHGIVVVGNGTGYPYIQGNNLSYNGTVNYVGIILDNSQAEVRGNSVNNSRGGVYANNNSLMRSGWFSDPYQTGSNTVTSNWLGLQSYWYSTMIMGLVQETGGTRYFYNACNWIYGNGMDASSVNGASLTAQGNWWGSNPPDPAKFSVASGGWLSYDYWRPYADFNCFPEGSGGCTDCLIPATGSEPGLAGLNDAISALARNKYDEAQMLYNLVLENSTKAIEREQALAGLYHIFRVTKNSNLKTVINRFRNEPGQTGALASELYASALVAEGSYTEAQDVLKEIRLKHAGSDYEKRALLSIAALGGYSASLRTAASNALTELKEKFAGSVDEGILVALSGAATPSGQGSALTSGQADEPSLSSYPNPFNPTAKIEYKLKAGGFVSLKVYDILGREVAVLVNEQKNPGSYSVSWDASRLPSGIYFSRLEAAGKSLVRKLMLVK